MSLGQGLNQVVLVVDLNGLQEDNRVQYKEVAGLPNVLAGLPNVLAGLPNVLPDPRGRRKRDIKHRVVVDSMVLPHRLAMPDFVVDLLRMTCIGFTVGLHRMRIIVTVGMTMFGMMLTDIRITRLQLL